MSEGKLSRLLASIYDLTTNGNVRWEGTIEDSSFRVATPSGSLRVTEDADRYRDTEYTVYLEDKLGRTITSTQERFRLNDVTDSVVTIRQLYNAARESALNVDGTIDQMLGEFEAGKIVVTPPREPKKPNDDDVPF